MTFYFQCNLSGLRQKLVAFRVQFHKAKTYHLLIFEKHFKIVVGSPPCSAFRPIPLSPVRKNALKSFKKVQKEMAINFYLKVQLYCNQRYQLVVQ